MYMDRWDRGRRHPRSNRAWNAGLSVINNQLVAEGRPGDLRSYVTRPETRDPEDQTAVGIPADPGLARAPLAAAGVGVKTPHHVTGVPGSARQPFNSKPGRQLASPGSVAEAQVVPVAA